MSASERIMQDLFELVTEQRLATRQLDSARVAALAETIQARFEELVAAAPVGRVDFTRRLKFLVAELRHNAALIAHARDAYRDTVAALRGGPPPAAGDAPEKARGAVLSVVG
jgi:hypothetical protein